MISGFEALSWSQEIACWYGISVSGEDQENYGHFGRVTFTLWSSAAVQVALYTKSNQREEVERPGFYTAIYFFLVTACPWTTTTKPDNDPLHAHKNDGQYPVLHLRMMKYPVMRNIPK